MAHKISITRSKKNLGFPETAKMVKRSIKTALAEEGVDCDCEIFVMLTDDEEIHEINLENRGVDRATDVLSFPYNNLTAGEFDADECDYNYETDCVSLGDMVISMERCKAQAEEFGHSFEREVSYLKVHSTLHLLGYDHEDEGEQKKQMRAREDEIMSKMGLNV